MLILKLTEIVIEAWNNLHWDMIFWSYDRDLLLKSLLFSYTLLLKKLFYAMLFFLLSLDRKLLKRIFL